MKKTDSVLPYKQLEEDIKKFVGSQFAVSTNTGTSALHLALVALGVGVGDEVIVPDFTMAACGFAVSYTGAKVVTVDCDDTLCIDWRKIESKITRRTKVIMPVHIYGNLCNMEEIMKIARRHNIKVVEDACEVHGSVFQSKADITCYSFYRNKIVHAEEGGMCTTDNAYLASRMEYLKNMAFDQNHSYYHGEIGFNYRMSDAQAKLALKSLKSYKKNIKRRWEIKKIYDKFFGEEKKLDTVWVYPINCTNPDKIVKNIPQARYFFKPLSTMPMWIQETGTNALFRSLYGCYLMVNEDMTDKEVTDICKKVKEVLG